MDDYELEYQTVLRSVEESIVQTIAELEIPTAADLTLIEKSSSSLDAWDYCCGIEITIRSLADRIVAVNYVFSFR